MKNLVRDWPLFLMMGEVIAFYVMIVINSRKQDKSKTEGESKGTDSKVKPTTKSSKNKV